MRINYRFVLRNFGEIKVIIPRYEADDSLHSIFPINNTGAFIWNLLTKETTENELIIAIQNKYGINFELSKKAVVLFLEQLNDIGCIDE